MIKVFIADDHQMFVDGLRALLQSIDGIEVIGEANNGLALMEKIPALQPDVILMDINMPQMDGIESTRQVVERYPHIKVLMLTMHDSREYIQKLLRAGAHGYILKNTGKDELQEAIETLAKASHTGEGGTYFSKQVTARIMEGLQNIKTRSSDYFVVELTERETDVLKLIAQELTTHEIGEKLHISHHTVETHRKNLISKLQVKNIAGLVKYAVQNGLVD